MNYISLYRKYRPDTFDKVCGQEHIVDVLRKEVEYDRIGNAYLFCGPRGTGKTSVARIFSKAMNCTGTVKPCNTCECCKMIDDNTMDYTEIDAASHNGVDDIRELVNSTKYSNHVLRKKIYIIDEVHMLSNQAFNALLKTLEEPPKDTVFILCTTESEKVPLTIASRCQKFTFKLLGIDKLTNLILDVCNKESVSMELNAANHIARLANGSARDAISLLEQVILFGRDSVINDTIVCDILGDATDDIVDSLLSSLESGNIKQAYDILHEVYYNGSNLVNLAESIYHRYAHAYIDYGKVDIEKLRVVAELISDLKRENSKLIRFEIALIKICNMNKVLAGQECIDFSKFFVLQCNRKRKQIKLSNGDLI